jgi:glutaredoxin-related protein
VDSLVLSNEEIIELTHYRRPAQQIRTLKALGIPALHRHDNTVCVLLADVTTKREIAAPPPQRKSVKHPND